MSDIDRVFARLGGGSQASTEQRETRRIPRKGGLTGNRVVEVVRLPSRGSAAPGSDSRRNDFQVRAQSWDQGFPAHAATTPKAPAERAAEQSVAAAPKVHVMPMWERSGVEPAAEPPPPPPRLRAKRSAERGASAHPAERRVADPFDAEDDGANCLRCGYLVEPAREKRGLMTCAACG
ncbi:hypothetical protein [Roseomonas sp. AR75]|jgi:hypothetical protein|uniref:hypothetical protein n=1 Tax=Roseomonas sp. AR75 TaxID=2562311 RepID=UPI0010C0FA68|nr:hypothetical protein [Roseomonas sp. AR75]